MRFHPMETVPTLPAVPSGRAGGLHGCKDSAGPR